MSEYYDKIRCGSMEFLFVQFGLSVFKFNCADNKWHHKTYNFYIFPKPHYRYIEDPRFLCQSSSMEFLASNGFDFNKVFREGIPYMTNSDQEKQRHNLTERHMRNNHNGTTLAQSKSGYVPIPEACEGFIAKSCTLIEKFLTSDKEELQLERCSPFMRKLMYQTVEERFGGKVQMETRPTEDGSRVLSITKETTLEERLRREGERQQQELKDLDDAFGFSKVIRLLSCSKKLIIGHNMLLDMCHLLNRFCCSLPEQYCEFKDMAKSTFPRVIDTKYLASGAAFRETITSTALNDLHKALSDAPYEMPTVDAAEGAVEFSTQSGRYHEAGYDAYVTGLCFLTMARHLGNGLPNQDVSSLPLLQPYINKVMVTKLHDVDHMNLGGDDPVPSRNHVFHATFPKHWRVNEISQVFNQFGSVYIVWIDDTSAYVALHKRELAASVIKKLPISSVCRVTPFVQYHEGFAASRVPSSPTGTKLKQRTQEKLQEAEKGSSIRKRKTSVPVRESKFSRRSIETIMEEEDFEINSDDEETTTTSLMGVDEELECE